MSIVLRVYRTWRVHMQSVHVPTSATCTRGDIGDGRLLVCQTTKLQEFLQFLQKIRQFLQKIKRNWRKKITESSKKWLFEKARKACRSSEILPNLEKNLRSNDPENEISSQNFGSPRVGGGGNFCKICRKLAKKFYAAFCSEFGFKNFKSPKNRISANFAGISTPSPSGRAKILRRNFIFGVVRPQNFLRIGKDFRTFTPFLWLFRKAIFLNFP